MCTRLHHFREHVRKKKISIHKIDTKLQLADMLTKPQPEELFVTQREMVMQWEMEHCSKEDLLLLLNPLRACDIIEKHANDNLFPDDEDEGQQEIKTPKSKRIINMNNTKRMEVLSAKAVKLTKGTRSAKRHFKG
jgi:hypothetical protein